MADPRDHDAPIWAITMGGIRNVIAMAPLGWLGWSWTRLRVLKSRLARLS
jgi:hypothetical protein